jgi:hypothetical protein
MNELGLTIRCQRCGDEMELRDPAPGMPWTPDQFWVCPRCGRHFWSTYPPPKPKPVAATDPAASS